MLRRGAVLVRREGLGFGRPKEMVLDSGSAKEGGFIVVVLATTFWTPVNRDEVFDPVFLEGDLPAGELVRDGRTTVAVAEELSEAVELPTARLLA